MSINLGIIGCGKMGHALMKGISGNPSSYGDVYAYDVDEARMRLFTEEFKAGAVAPGEVVAGSDMIILAVKPGQIKEVLQVTRDQWNGGKLLVSIAAGIKIANIEKQLPEGVRVVRVMPNTPCLVGEGVSAISGGHSASPEDLQMVGEMLGQVGLTITIEETYMDAVTAVSGSGPAYAFLLAEAFMDAALSTGLSSDISRQLVLQTLKGSIKMLEQTGAHPAVLKAQVTSPGGTTIAGLRELEAGGLREAFFAAVEKAKQRSIELGAD
ncbi:MAG: pyrroline-5-carboxylate reductase [Syntrophomonadaceae bacterium]